MKIAFFTDCYLDLTGGITTNINAQKTELERRGHTVYIFSTGFPRSQLKLRSLAKKNIFMVPSCKLFFRGLTPVSRRPAIIEKWLLKHHPEIQNFDVFYVHYESGCSIAGLRLARRFDIPSIQVMHGREDMGETNIIPYGLRTIVATALNKFHSWYIPHPINVSRDDYLADDLAKAKMWTLMVNHANYADLVITPSRHFKKKLIHYGVTRPVEVLPNGVSDDLFVKDLSPRTFSKTQPLRIIWHSRISAEKRMMPFLRALSQINNKYQFDIYGGGGDYYRARRFVRRHHMNVTFHGNTDFSSIYRNLLKSHLDVLVSYNFDTFGNTLIEAESAGTPVFFVDPDMKEIVPKGSYILANSPDETSMTKSLQTIFEHPETIQKMSETMLAHRNEVRCSHCTDLLERYFELVQTLHRER